jgi:coenzyme F420 biosynthesis associated uncharacterized protein
VEGTAAARLIDWEAAARIGSGVAGTAPPTSGAERAFLEEEMADVVIEADALVTEFTGLSLQGSPSRPWVMTREEWIAQNLRAFEQVLEPVAARLLGRRLEGAMAPIRRKLLAAQVGGIIGYLARRVLGQYDLLLPPDDRELVYFVGPNLSELERKHRFPRRDFRLWLALHEVTHRVQFEGVGWLRAYLGELVDAYLGSLELDARKLLERLRRAREEVVRGRGWRDMGLLFALMSPEQRDLFLRMQALMSLLEGHATYVMDRLGEDRVRSLDRMRAVLHERRHRQGFNRIVQRAVGLGVKVRQYDLGARFVTEVVDQAGPEGFARVWERREHLPTLEEIGRPEVWVQRVTPV